jgi:hypothetical protein
VNGSRIRICGKIRIGCVDGSYGLVFFNPAYLSDFPAEGGGIGFL